MGRFQQRLKKALVSTIHELSDDDQECLMYCGLGHPWGDLGFAISLMHIFGSS
jgi:hypothetical protein